MQATQRQLTVREKEVLDLIGEGLQTKEIADRLCISIKTVEAHRLNIYRKLSIRNVAEAVRYVLGIDRA